MNARRLALLGALVLALAAGAAGAQRQATPAPPPDLSRPGSAFAPKGKPGNWQTRVGRTARGHLIGDPQAKARLIAFVSYTCPGCAEFAARGEPAIEMFLITPGTMNLEVRPRIHGGLDLSAALIAQCGDPAGFKTRHQLLMATQHQWLAKARAAPASQQAIWERGDRAARMNAASALGLSAMFARRGGSTAALDACLSDDAAAQRLLAGSAADAADFALPPAAAAPAFALDGKLVAGADSWERLYPVLSARFAQGHD